MRFNYKSRTSEGEIQAGTVEASTHQAALDILRRRHLVVTSLESAKRPFYAKKIKFFERITTKDIVIFSRQLAVLFNSEIPLVEALRTLAEQTKNRAFEIKIFGIAEDVDGGMLFSNSLARYPKIFNKFYINMIKSGEVAGNLSEVLEYLADHTEREFNLNAKIKGAMIYPSFIIGMLILVGIIMLLFVVPNLVEIFEESGVKLPWTTKTLIFTSDFVCSWWWLLLLVIGGLIGGIIWYKKTPEGKDIWDRIVLELPILGNIAQKMYLSRFSENLATLIKAGIPITQALEITAGIIGNNIYQKIVLKARVAVRRGETISSVLAKEIDIPPVVTQMTAVGEKSGKLDSILLNLAKFYQEEVDRIVNNLVDIIQPVLIVILGIFVGLFVASILLPIYNLAGTM